MILSKSSVEYNTVYTVYTFNCYKSNSFWNIFFHIGTPQVFLMNRPFINFTITQFKLGFDMKTVDFVKLNDYTYLNKLSFNNYIKLI